MSARTVTHEKPALYHALAHPHFGGRMYDVIEVTSVQNGRVYGRRMGENWSGPEHALLCRIYKVPHMNVLTFAARAWDATANHRAAIDRAHKALLEAEAALVEALAAFRNGEIEP